MPKGSDWLGPIMLFLGLGAVWSESVPASLSRSTPVGRVQARSAADQVELGGATAETAGEAPGGRCEAVVRALLDQSNLALRLPLPLRNVLLVTLPDPIETPAAAVFDSLLETMVIALGRAGYTRDRAYLPWRARAEHDAPAHALPCPGVMLFRGQAEADSDLAVLVIGESSIWGIARQTWAESLKLIRLPRPRCCHPGELPSATPGCGDSCVLCGHTVAPPGAMSAGAAEQDPHCPDEFTLRVLGPYYSASAAAIANQLAALGRDTTAAFRVASGSLTVSAAGTLIDRVPRVQWQPFSRSNEDREDVLLEFIGRGPQQTAAQYAATRIALLRESGTFYGQAQKRTAELLEVEYPPNVSALRDAHALLQERIRAPETGRFTELPSSAERRAQAPDMIPALAPEQTLVVHDLTLRDIATTLRQAGVNDAIVTGVLPDDTIFLAQRLRHELPDLRLSFYFWDRSFTHSDHAADMRGALVVSSYPPALEESTELTPLSRETAIGLYHALGWLFDRDGSGREPEAVQNMSIGVISRGRYWPLEAEKRISRLRVPSSFWGASVLGVVLLVIGAGYLWWKTGPKRAGGDGGDPEPKAEPLDGLGLRADALFAPVQLGATAMAWSALAASSAIMTSAWWRASKAANAYAPIPLAFALLTVLMLGLAAVSCTRQARCFALRRSPPVSESRVQEGDLALWRRRRRPCAALLLLALCTLGFGAAASAGVLGVDDDACGVFLVRALELGSGASPFLPLLLCGAFIYGFGAAYAIRFRLLAERGLIAHAVADPKRFWPRERALYDAALAPRDAGDIAVLGLLLLAPWVLVWYARRDFWWRTHDFALENGPLSLALFLALFTCLGATLMAALQIVQLWRRLQQLLQWFVASDLLDSFTQLPILLRRAVAEQLAEGAQDENERWVVYAALDPDPSSVPNEADHSTGAPKLEQLERAAEATRRALAQQRGAPAKLRARNQKGLAAYVAFGLVRWVTQFSYLMTLAVIGSVVLVAASAAYVFTLRRLLSTTFSLLIVLVVVLGAIVFAGSERDDVLSRIGGTTPGKLSWHGHMKRVLSWAVLPLLIALATNYPKATQNLMNWFQTLGR